MENKRQSLELADILSKKANFFLNNDTLCVNQKKAYQAIVNCRTQQLGGHLQTCNNCNHQKIAYNSCRNRHCPKCQFIKKAKWVDKLSGNLPPVKYFHLVFTIPQCLHKLFYLNQAKAYDLLFKSAGLSIIQSAKNTKYLGANAGAVGVLHTWGQALTYHPHIHMIVPAGGLTEDGTEWIPSHKKFFLPVKVLSKIFRGILCKNLENACISKVLKLPDDAVDFNQIKQLCYLKNWVVYSEKPFSTPQNLINYLGNYTHRVAIVNQRLIKHQDNKVSFKYKDYKTGGVKKVMTLDEDVFIKRFLQHVLPNKFCKIRYFGFLSLRHLKQNLNYCLTAINKTVYLPQLEGLSGLEVYEKITKTKPLICCKCKKGKMITQQDVLKPP